MKVSIGRRSGVSLLLAGALLAVVGGVAWAAIPGPGGVIQGCYDAGGNLKVVEQLPCPKGNKPIAWNQTGPQAAPASTYIRQTFFEDQLDGDGDGFGDVFEPGLRVSGSLECDDRNDQITGAGVRGIPWTSDDDPAVGGITATSASVSEGFPGNEERPASNDGAYFEAVNTSPYRFLRPGQGWIVCIAVD
jgi:hypothetical protein